MTVGFVLMSKTLAATDLMLTLKLAAKLSCPPKKKTFEENL